MKHRYTSRQGRRGMMLVWGIVLLTLLFTLGLVTVDVGAIYHARGKLQSSVDNAARYGATGLRNGNIGQARTRIRAALADNPIGGMTPNATDANIEFGLWDPATRTLIPVEAGEERSATAVRVTATMSRQNNNGLLSYFGAFLGYDSYDITSSATAAIGQPLSIEIDAKASPYLAGMGPDSGAGNGDIPFTANTRLPDPPTHSTYADYAPVQV
ncbi:MAG: pilus assembly protein TadG-related protein, partial [Planctomycetota bacterium]